MTPIVRRALRIVLAVLAFFVARWVLTWFFPAIHVVPPDPIITLIAVAVALAVLLEGLWRPMVR